MTASSPHPPPRAAPDPLRATARRWLAERRPAALIRVSAAAGSTPRGVGTRMLVSAEDCAGTIGGGHLEWQAIAAARQALAGAANGDFPTGQLRFALGPSLGQCCGGRVELQIAPLTASELADWPDTPALFHLMLYGAGHVGQALVHALSSVPCTIDWIENRDEIPGLPRSVRGRRAGAAAEVDALDDCRWRWIDSDAPELEARDAPAGAFHLVMTHDHDLDLRLCEQVLRDGHFGWLGLIGSRTKRQRFERRMRDRGVPADRIARMVCPVGIEGIQGKDPSIIALAVAAQLLQVASLRESHKPVRTSKG